MKHVIAPMAGLALPVLLSGCAGLTADPAALAQAVRILNEGCQRTVDLTLDNSQPRGGSLRVTRACAPAGLSGPKPSGQKEPLPDGSDRGAAGFGEEVGH